jgi:hypothetical protein
MYSYYHQNPTPIRDKLVLNHPKPSVISPIKPVNQSKKHKQNALLQKRNPSYGKVPK